MKKQEIENTLEEKELGLKTFFLIGIGVICAWGLFWVITSGFIQTWDDRGTFGDMFGAINALFSGLALAGIIYTMLLQRQELKLQRLELKANREELARTATAQENSEKELKRQADNLKSTARLNALGTLMNYHINVVNNSSDGSLKRIDSLHAIRDYTKEIESVLEQSK